MTTQATVDSPVWRSLLYVPVNVPRFVNKAHMRGADGIILDLEDSIPPAQKDDARLMVQEAAGKIAANGTDVRCASTARSILQYVISRPPSARM